ncbi:STAS domain-containing protein [Thiosulfatimonas sediminis]|uniref:STAS domain-containing protein n=1 Tax=Thiosulfatimonas sediminis TaxID=2675054 RepID=A0A6F8PUD6_9GAMM|nr:STAS domain-containing protein [Thiosulfatimonas sediminis]BBP45590.1 STAS domain-containing protein [Thiosulfatimonas sediminis]
MNTITSHQDGKNLMIQITGTFDLSAFDNFHQAYPSDMSNISTITVDLARVVEVDSSAIGMLLSLWKVAGQEKGKVIIINANASVKELLQIGLVTQYIDIK